MSLALHWDGELLRIEFSGTVTTGDLALLIREVLALETRLGHAPPRLSNLTAVERLEIAFGDVDRIARSRREVHLPNPIKSAVVAPQSVHYGIARMFQTLNDHPKVTVRIFPDEESALAWLREPPA